jgi:hypothetical protein
VTHYNETEREKSGIVNSVEEMYRILLYEIVDNLIINLSAHFSSIEKWNCDRFDT